MARGPSTRKILKEMALNMGRLQLNRTDLAAELNRMLPHDQWVTGHIIWKWLHGHQSPNSERTLAIQRWCKKNKKKH